MEFLSAYWMDGMAFVVSLTLSALIVLTRDLHLSLTERRSDVSAVQAAHSVPTPRIGGVAVLLSAVILGAIATFDDPRQSWLLGVSLMPVFIAGLAEDLGLHVSPSRRLLAAALSSLLAIILFGVWIGRADIPLLDLLIAFAPVGIALTIFGTAGICNAFNLIDGLNGLSGSISITVALALGLIASQAGEGYLASWAFILGSALAGFLFMNFPWGKIFMGDAGAYGVGHLLSWIAVLMINAIPDLTSWALLLVFFWPLADTVLAIVRRRRSGKRMDQPDRLHFHQLVMRTLEIGKLGRGSRRVSNPLSTLVMMPMFAMPPLVGVLLWDNGLAAALAFVGFSVLFATTYSVGLLLARASRKGSGRQFLYELATRRVRSALRMAS